METKLSEWSIEPGEQLNRRSLHAKYGGAWYGGIEPSGRTPNVLLFSDATAGSKFGYKFDGWHPDGTFHYTGEGQLGDQEMREGNRVIRDHLAEGRALRLFEKAGTDVIYVGEFTVPDESHWIVDEAPDRDGNLRSVFVFRLKPAGEVWVDDAVTAPSETLTRTIPLEAANVELYVAQRAASEPSASLRTESLLVRRYAEWLQRTSRSEAERQAIPTAAGRPMFTDMFVRETRELIEAKASSSRDHLRLALGQILDYARYVDHSSLAVLVPTRPADEMISLLIAHGVACIWEDSSSGNFDRRNPEDGWRQ